MDETEKKKVAQFQVGYIYSPSIKKDTLISGFNISGHHLHFIYAQVHNKYVGIQKRIFYFFTYIL